ncbi:MAG: S9 family peptidase [Chthonomonadales bacterium]|nr:S9 family peptidase [Chthonomonadales bacterium]
MPSRPVVLEDLARFSLVGDTQIAPDGRRVVFTCKRTDPGKNRYFTALWMADAVSGGARQFTGDEHADSSPRWSPDGTRIAFVSDRAKPGSQLFLIPADGGEARQLTRLDEGGIQAPAWSPDGRSIAFLYRATPEAYREKAGKEREERGASPPPRVHSKLFYRLDGFGYFDDSYWQVWVADAETGEARALTEGRRHHGAPAWSPDGSRLAFVANLRDDSDLTPLLDSIWIVPAAGGDLVRVEAPEGPKGGLAWSPDGAWLAYAGHTDTEDSEGTRNDRVIVVRLDGEGGHRDLTGASDLAVGYLTLSDMHEAGGGSPLAWSPDGRALYFPVSAFGDTRLYRVGVDGANLLPLTPMGHEMGAFTISQDGSRAAVALANATDTGDVYAGDLRDDGLELLRLTHVNARVLDEVALQMPEEFRLPNGEGGAIHGWVLRPTPFEIGRRYPCVLYVHGGPALQYGGEAAPFHELQWLAANGYAVIFANPRGSKGYGEAHTRAILGDWGGRDWADVMAVADHAAALPYVEPARMAIMGGSYGGFMTAWAVGHTDRFRCAIADRLVANLHSMSGTCDFPWEPGKFYKGNAWDDPSDLWRSSPLAFAGRIQTPLLLIHSDGDLRCPIEQAEQLFAALRWQRKPVELVRYPAETSHGLSREGPPDLRIDRLRRNLAWLDRHLKA